MGQRCGGAVDRLIHLFKCSCEPPESFWEVGKLHPSSAIECEIRMMPLVWEARRRCIEFWIRGLGKKGK